MNYGLFFPLHRRLRVAVFAMTVAICTASSAAITQTGQDSRPDANRPANRLQDVQIGEKDQVTRVALICLRPCPVTQQGEQFLVAGLSETATLAIDGTSKNARALVFTPIKNPKGAAGEPGSLLSIASEKALLRTHIGACTASGAPATCLDLEFSRQPYARDNTVSRAVRQTTKPIGAAPSDDKINQASAVALATGSGQRVSAPGIASPSKAGSSRSLASSPTVPPPTAPLPAAPSLAPRSSPQRIALAATLRNPASPLRLTPLRPTSQAAKPQASGNTPVVTTAAPTSPGTVLRPVETDRVLARVDFRAVAETVLNTEFDRDRCDGAQKTLDADAWALGSMGVVGFCQAAAGQFSEAEDIFKRLLTLQPENYEALVGRALIAGVAGETGVALKFLNEALALNPPNALAKRIEGVVAAL
ncbi:MAG: hypothetical protein AAGH42_02410 [Pseudomonadota bacterium]